MKEIRLKTGSIKSLHTFYDHNLLLKNSLSSDGNCFTVYAGETNLVFEESAEDAFYHFAFNIPSNKIDEAYAWTQERVQLLWLEEYESYIARFDDWHARSIYFFDPLGNIVEFVARFDLQDNVNEEFSASQIRNVSEIGLVFPKDSFEKDVGELMKSHSLNYFDKQPPMKHFRAVGDDQGLFIIVPENRNWYPTSDRISRIYPISIRFVQKGKEHELTLRSAR